MHLAALDQKAQQKYAWGEWRGADPVACERQGGIVSVRYESRYESGVGVSSGYMVETAVFSCTLPPAPPAPAPAPAQITVSPTVQTTVSPQISPNLTQQDQPSNSGVNAGTSQASPAAQTSGDQQSWLTTIQNLLDRARESSNPAPDTVYSGSPVPIVDPLEAGTGEVAAPSKLEQYTPLLVFAAAAIGLVTVLKRSKMQKG